MGTKNIRLSVIKVTIVAAAVSVMALVAKTPAALKMTNLFRTVKKGPFTTRSPKRPKLKIPMILPRISEGTFSRSMAVAEVLWITWKKPYKTKKTTDMRNER